MLFHALIELQTEIAVEHATIFVDLHDGQRVVADQTADEIGDFRKQLVGTQKAGEFASDGDHGLHRLRLSSGGAIESRVFDGERHTSGNQFHQLDVAWREVVRLIALNVDDTDDAVFQDHRHRQLALHAGHDADVVRKLTDVVDTDGPAFGGGASGDAAADFDAQFLGIGGMADVIADAQLPGALGEQQNREDAIVDGLLHHARDARQQRVEIKRRIGGFGDFQQEMRGLVFAFAMESVGHGKLS